MAKLNDIAKKMHLEVSTKKENNKKKEYTNPSKRRTWINNKATEEVNIISPDDIQNWELSDRPQIELGDIESLAHDLKNIGQQQPCIVRPTQMGSKFQYELIAGERRWRAAKLANIDLKVIIKDLSNKEASLIQIAENNNRKDLSDYAKGMQYYKLINMGILSQKDLSEKLKKSKQYVSAMLSFQKIPEQIILAIGDMSKVSCRTAETIKQLANKGPKYIDFVISKATLIRNGKIGNKSLLEQAYKAYSTTNASAKKTGIKVLSNENRHLFTWRKDNNGIPSIHFPKNIAESIDIEFVSNQIKAIVEKSIVEKYINKKSAQAD